MQIQYIGCSDKKLFDSKMFTFSSVKHPLALDSFDINVIALNDSKVWYSDSIDKYKLNLLQDYYLLKDMVKNSKTTRIVYVLPQDYYLHYHKGSTSYNYSEEIKKIIESIKVEILTPCFMLPILEVHYENNVTVVNGHNIRSAFYFQIEENVLTKGIHTNKTTTFSCRGRIYTTLDLMSEEDFLSFFDTVGLNEENELTPDWMNDIKMFNDLSLLSNIQRSENQIYELKKIIGESQNQLDENNRYKSILYTSGDELVSVVFNILEQLFSVDLSLFVDKKEEDFRFQCNDKTFIGEIKGISKNIKSINIAQLDEHYQKYCDECNENNVPVNGKALLIINHQRVVPLTARQPVNDEQIRIAKRNESLIIETHTLLKVFEAYKQGVLTNNEVFKMFSENTGLLIYGDNPSLS